MDEYKTKIELSTGETVSVAKSGEVYYVSSKGFDIRLIVNKDMNTNENNKGKDREILFVAKDISEALGYKNFSNTLKRYCRNITEKTIPHRLYKDFPIKVSIVDRNDFNRMIMHAGNTTLVNKFRLWVSSEAVPAIKKAIRLEKIAENKTKTLVTTVYLKDNKDKNENENEAVNINNETEKIDNENGRIEFRIFTSDKYGSLRTVFSNGEVWFCGRDIFNSIDAWSKKHAATYIRRHLKNNNIIYGYEFGINFPDIDRYMKSALFINEDGLKILMHKAKSTHKDIIMNFYNWVVQEVMPTFENKNEDKNENEKNSDNNIEDTIEETGINKINEADKKPEKDAAKFHVFNNDSFGIIRAITLNGNIWFSGVDIYTASGLKNKASATTFLFKKFVKKENVKYGKDFNISYLPGKCYRMMFMNLKDTMHLLGIIKYSHVKAGKILGWINEEILPTINSSSVVTEDKDIEKEKSTEPTEVIVENKATDIDTNDKKISNDMVRVFNNKDFGNIRITIINNEPWFIGKDVAIALGYTDTVNALKKHIDDEDKKKGCQNTTPPVIDSNGHRQYPTFINESGVYSLVFSSKLPKAKEFKRWVTSEILPTIREHGAYMTNEVMDNIANNPDLLIKLATNLKEEKAKREAAEIKVAEYKPKADFADAIAATEDTIAIGDFAKILNKNGFDIGQNRLFTWLRKNGYIIKTEGRNVPTQKYVDRGLFKVVEHPFTNAYGEKMISVTSRITPKGQQYFLKRFKG